SQVFTGALYDIMADIFAFRRNPALRDDAAVLYDVAEELRTILIKAIQAAPAMAATFADVANQMLNICAATGKPVQYRNFIRNRFTVRQVVVQAAPFTADHAEGVALQAQEHVSAMPDAAQDRRGCCGTMQHYEY